MNLNFAEAEEKSNNISYKAFNNTIEIVFNNESYITNATDNIISKISISKDNNNISLDENKILIHLSQLIKYNFFKEKIKDEIKSNYNALKKNQKDKNSIYLVNKDIINYYKNYFDYEKMVDLLKNKQKLKNTDFSKLTENFEILDKELKSHLNEIKQKKTSIKFDSYENNLKEKTYNTPLNKEMTYYVDFDIINGELNEFLTENRLFKKEEAIKATYIAGDKKLLLFFEIKNKFYMQIGNFDENDNFINEYIIKFTKTLRYGHGEN